MPVFGKSGTWRMCCLRSMTPRRCVPGLSDIELHVLPAWFLGIDLDLVDACGRRPLPERALDARDRFGLALHVRFDPAVGTVPHPACHAFARRGLLREPPEPDALNAS